jgi:hypothetical protein
MMITYPCLLFKRQCISPGKNLCHQRAWVTYQAEGTYYRMQKLSEGIVTSPRTERSKIGIVVEINL